MVFVDILAFFMSRFLHPLQAVQPRIDRGSSFRNTLFSTCHNPFFAIHNGMGFLRSRFFFLSYRTKGCIIWGVMIVDLDVAFFAV